MSLSSVLSYVVIGTLTIAFVFFVMGTARLLRRSTRGGLPAEEIQRLKAFRRADWTAAVLLVGIALLALGSILIGSGPIFEEPSGNVADGVLLIAGMVGFILAIVLLIRYMALSHAPRGLDKQM